MLRIGVMGTANIAKTRMIPTILSLAGLEYAGVARASEEEWNAPDAGPVAVAYSDAAAKNQELAASFQESFGGEVYEGYMEMLERDDIDIVYMPLPPSLHFQWGMEALKHHKHLLMEKPFTLSANDTKTLLDTAEREGLAVIENYGFMYHTQFLKIKELLDAGKIGELRLIRTAFGFPHRAQNDFRYSRHFGGGALYDCGGYTLKLASSFLEDPISLLAPSLIVTPGHEVDICGSATLCDRNRTVQLAFGMDHAYKCELELWGSTGTLLAQRIYTAPGDLAVTLVIKSNAGEEKITVEPCNQFGEIVKQLLIAIRDPKRAASLREEILRQAELVDAFAESCLKG